MRITPNADGSFSVSSGKETVIVNPSSKGTEGGGQESPPTSPAEPPIKKRRAKFVPGGAWPVAWIIGDEPGTYSLSESMQIDANEFSGDAPFSPDWLNALHASVTGVPESTPLVINVVARVGQTVDTEKVAWKFIRFDIARALMHPVVIRITVESK